MTEENIAEFNTMPMFDFKDHLLSQYGIAYTAMSDYVLNPNYKTQRHARRALTKIVYPLFPKLYVLQDKEAVDYVAYFMTNPDKYHLMDLQTVFLIVQRTLEKLGMTKFESYTIPKHKAFLEGGD